jgi:molybdate transport system substrate-binding protein
MTNVNAAELRVISGGGAQSVLQRLAPQFESATGGKVQVDFAVVGAIQQKLTVGEKPDVLLVPAPLLDTIERAGAFRARSKVLIGKIGIGIVVREGASVADVSTVDALRKTLLEARSVVFPSPKLTPSGAHLLQVFEQIGIAHAMQSKITFQNAIDGGVNLVRDGEVEVGFFLVTEILPTRGVRFIGTLPPALQSYVVYVAAVSGDTTHAEKASQFVDFIAGARQREAWKAAGFEAVDGK